MQGIEQMNQMDIFYHAMNYTSKGIMDAASGGAFRRKSVEEATQLIEELAKSNYRAPSKALRSTSRLRAGGVIKPNNNLPTHYTLALRNHENLSYGGGVQQGLRPAQNYQNYAPPGLQCRNQVIQRGENQGQRRS